MEGTIRDVAVARDRTRLHVVAGSGHVISEEQPAAVVEAILTFVP